MRAFWTPRAITRVLLAGVGLLAGSLALAAPGATAAVGHKYLTQIAGTAPGVPFGSVEGVAVNSSGDVYVTDGNRKVVDEFSPAGALLAELTGTGTPTGKFEGSLEGLAVDGANDLYVVDQNGDVYKYSQAGAYLADIATGLRTPVQATVDGEENLYVGDQGTASVHKLTTAGAPVDFTATESYVDGNEITGTPAGSFPVDRPLAVAVNDTSHEIYVASGGEGHEALYAYTAAGEFLWEVTSTPFGHLGRLEGAAVDQADGDVLVADDFKTIDGEYLGRIDEFSASGAFLDILPGTPAAPFGSVAGYDGVDVAANGDVYFPEPRSKVLDIFGPDATAPSAVSEAPATGVSGTQATVPGTVTPEGGDTQWRFQYGLTTDYGSATATVDAGSAETAQHVSASLSDLEPNITYHYRLVAENANAQGYGVDATFKTLPVVPTVNDAPSSASNITRSTATLDGTINPENSPTSSYFAYVSEAGYDPGAASPIERYAAGVRTESVGDGSGLGDEKVPLTLIQGLLPDTTYHYALVALNQAGLAVGEDHTFTTGAGTPAQATTGAASGVSQNGATIAGVVNTQGEATSYGFEVSTNAADLGPETGLGAVGVGLSEAPVSLTLSGLAPNTTYYYRVVATNTDGTGEGAILSFTTPGYPDAVLSPPAGEPLLAAPAIAFPPVSRGITTSSETKKAKKPKHKAKKKPRHKRKANRHKHPQPKR